MTKNQRMSLARGIKKLTGNSVLIEETTWSHTCGVEMHECRAYLSCKGEHVGLTGNYKKDQAILLAYIGRKEK